MGIQPVVAGFAAVLLFAISDGFRIPYKCEDPTSPKMPKTPEKCFSTLDTGSDWGNEERLSAIDLINMFRGMIANECDAFKLHKPKPALFEEATYKCELEAEAKFDCPAKKADFKSTEKYYRAMEATMSNSSRTAIFHRVSPWIEKTTIDPATQLSNEFDPDSTRNVINFLRFVLNAKATKYGCYVKVCDVEGQNVELISCASDQPMRLSGPIYTPGKRCQTDSDCNNLQCHAEYGMCHHRPANGTDTGGSKPVTVVPSATATTSTASNTFMSTNLAFIWTISMLVLIHCASMVV